MLSVTIIWLPDQPSEENKHTVGYVPVRKNHDGSMIDTNKPHLQFL